MKILKSTSFLLFLTFFTKRIFACTQLPGSNIIEENHNIALMFIAGSLVLFIATFFLYFKKKRKGLIPIIVSFLVVIFTYLASNTGGGDCGYGAVRITWLGMLIALVCFAFQFFTWLFGRKLK